MRQIQQHFQRHTQSSLSVVSVALLALTLAGCSSVGNTINNISVWPFAGPVERVIPPPNGIEYKCIGGKGFYLRYLDNNAAAWVILPEREFRLEKQNTASRYVNGANVLSVEGETLALTESGGAASAYSGCKAASAPAATEAAQPGLQITPAQSPRP